MKYKTDECNCLYHDCDNCPEKINAGYESAQIDTKTFVPMRLSSEDTSYCPKRVNDEIKKSTEDSEKALRENV